MIGRTCSNKAVQWHDRTTVIRRFPGMILGGMLVFGILIPFSAAGLPGSSVFDLSYTHMQLKFQFIHPDFVVPLYVCVLLYGIILGVYAFAFLMDKRQSTLYFSLGITRNALFWNRFLAGVFSLVCAVGIPMLVSYVLNRMALGWYEGMDLSFLYCLGGLLLTGLFAFSITALACSLAGTILEALLYDLLFLGGVMALLFTLQELIRCLVWGNALGVSGYYRQKVIMPGLPAKFSWLNPLAFFLESLKSYSSFFRSSEQAVPVILGGTILVLWLFLLGVGIALALWALRRRRAEDAGIASQNSFLLAGVILIVNLTVYGIIFSFLYSRSPALAILGGILGVVFFCWLWNALRPSARTSRRRALAFAGLQTVLCLVLTGGIFWGGNAVKQQLPAAGNLVSATISYVGSPNYLAEQAAGFSSETGGYYMDSCYTFYEYGEIEQVQELHKSLIERGRRPMELDEDNFRNTVVPYDIELRYTLADGSEQVWYYDRCSLNQLEEMLWLDDTIRIRSVIGEVVSGTQDSGSSLSWALQAYVNGEIYITDSWYSNPCLIGLDAEKREQLLQALAQDLGDQSVEDRYFPKEEPVGILLFTLDGVSDCNQFLYHLGNAQVYLTENFTETLAFLEENQLLSLMEFQGTVESVILQKYNPFGGINGRTEPLSNYFMGYVADSADAFLVQEDFGSKQPITEPERLAKLVPQLKNNYYMSCEGYLAAVKLTGSDRYVYKYLPGTVRDILP